MPVLSRPPRPLGPHSRWVLAHRLITSLVVALLAAVTFGACHPSPSSVPPPLRFSGIPDADKAKLTELYGSVATYLSAELGVAVEYVHVPDYTAAVTALAANKIDFVWLGGVTAVQAQERTGGEIEFVAARAQDLHFRSYFIAHRELIDDGTFHEVKDHDPMPLSALSDMAPALKGKSFTFGSKSSTSGHIMPRHFLQDASVNINPERDFAGSAAYQLKGSHSATLRTVAAGGTQLGALNYSVWELADPATQAQAPVIFVTPEYVDYCMIAHRRIGADRIAAIRKALLKLDPADPKHATVLEAFGAKAFVAVDASDWDGIRAVLGALRDKGLLR